MHQLTRFAGADVDHLREVQLVARGVIAEDLIERSRDERMDRERPERRRTGDHAAAAARAVAAEVVGAHRRGFDVGGHLGVDGVHDLRGDELGDAHAPVFGQNRRHVVGRGPCPEHAHLPEISRHPASLWAPNIRRVLKKGAVCAYCR